MKKNLTSLLLVAFMIVASAFLSYAAFPVASQKATVVTTASTTSTALQEVMQQQQEEYASNAPTTQAPAAPQGGKSQVVALILCIVVGGIGIHRFYLGYTWQGIVQLLTLGGCGIWSLIDLIRIITGDLQPKHGRYAKTL